MAPGRKTVEHRIFTTTDKRVVDQETISRIYGGEEPLMEVAGYQIAECIYRSYGQELEQGVVVLAGRGNNGGDGYVVARWLQAWGCPVHVVAEGVPRTDAAQWAQKSWIACGGSVVQDVPDVAPGVIVDSLFGSGISRPVSADSVAGDHIAWANNQSSSIRVAVDIPSGCLSEPEVVFQAHRTFALGCLGPMHVVEPMKSWCGSTQLLSLGFESELAQLQVEYGEYIKQESSRKLPMLQALNHKASCRPVVIVGGSAGMEGAALLACLGARKAGAAYIHWVQLDASAHATIPDEIEIVRHQVSGAADIENVAASMQSAVWILGPGLIATDSVRSMLDEILHQLAGSDDSLVVDAGAVDWLAELDGSLGIPAVVTPHPGEAARLAGSTIEAVQKKRLQTAEGIAQQFGCHVVLKGTDPVLFRFGTDPGPRYRIFDFEASALATAGSGDVLAGVIGALAARSRQAPLDSARMFEAATDAVHVQQVAGAVLTTQGVSGWSAREIAAEIQGVMRGS